METGQYMSSSLKERAGDFLPHYRMDKRAVEVYTNNIVKNFTPNMSQDLIKAKSDINTAPPFDIDFFTTNLIKNNWKSMIAEGKQSVVNTGRMLTGGVAKDFFNEVVLPRLEADENLELKDAWTWMEWIKYSTKVTYPQLFLEEEK